MSVFDRILSASRGMLLLEYRIDQLTAQVDKLNGGQEQLRDRVLRIEVIIGEAQRRPAVPRIDR